MLNGSHLQRKSNNILNQLRATTTWPITEFYRANKMIKQDFKIVI